MEQGKPTKSKVCIVVSTPMTVVAFLRDQLKVIGEHFDLSVVANADDGGFLKDLGIPAAFMPVAIVRKIRPWTDLLALFHLARFLLRERFQLVHSITPKAGLLAMAASYFAGVPVRLHTFTGQVWATKSGLSRVCLRLLDQLIAGFATDILVDSVSQRQFLIANGVVRAGKATVLGKGSISGVDTLRFRPRPTERLALRERSGIADEDIVFVYVGRLNRDKGIPELLRAFEAVLARCPNIWLLAVGPDEESMDLLVDNSPAKGRIIREGYTSTPELFLAAGDVFVLPSHREGFGSTIIEAAAAGIPAIGSRIYGLTDAIVDGQTGILHKPGDFTELAEAMACIAEDPAGRRRMAKAAQHRAETQFSMPEVTANTLAYYKSLLDSPAQ